jgi:colicin import membrane protein
MDALSFSERRLSKEELFVGFGGSVVVHAVVFASALILPWVMPHKSVQMPFYSVNLVSMQDLGSDSSAPKSGGGGKSSRAAKAKDTQTAPSRRVASAPIVPVKRLQFDEAPKKPETELKRLNTAEPPPEMTDSVQPSVSIDKNLDAMIPKPKTRPKPPPISQEPGAGGDTSKRAAAQSSGGAGAQGASEKGAGDEKAPAGQSSSGSAGKGGEGKGAKGGSPHGSEAGSPDGKDVGLARKLYYTEVWNAIRRQWALPEFLKSQKLEAVLVVVVRRDGKILSLQFEKKSGQALFDESVERAVRKADPLPPFPEIYSPPKEEIGLRFRPEDLA